ncbi:8341_t:CDS:2, partial [Diversispora eburnea]
VIQSWTYLEGHMLVLENVNAGNFNDTVKCNILKSMMGGKYAPVLTNNAIQRLTQKKYQPYDTPDTYEVRIRLLLLGVTDNDAQVLGFLKSHLTVSQQSFYNTKIIEVPIIPQLVFPIPNTQKMIDETLVKQKTNYDVKIEKLRKEVQFSKIAKKSLSNLKIEEYYKNYYVAKYFNDLGIYSKKDLDLNYPEKPFQRPRTQQKVNFTRLEEKVDEIGNMLSHLNINNQFQKPVAKSNRTQQYYLFQLINSSILANEESNEGGYDKEKNI